MPTYSNAIADATPDPQKPVATPPRRPRAKEFWEAEPGDPEVAKVGLTIPKIPLVLSLATLHLQLPLLLLLP